MNNPTTGCLLRWRLLSGRALSAALAAAGALGCGDVSDQEWLEGEEAAELDEVEQSIINGTATSDWIGLAMLSFGPAGPYGQNYCSGVLLSDRWVLTNGSCVAPYRNSPGDVTVTLGTTDQTSSPVRSTASQILIHPSRNAAVVKLSNPLREPATGRSYDNPLYLGNSWSLVGSTVTCFGYGNYGFTVNVSTDRILRSANLTVDAVWYGSDTYSVRNNSAQQIPWQHDQGGPCTIVKDGVRFITGIQKECQYTETSVYVCRQEAASDLRDWVWASTGSAAGLFVDPNFGGAVQAFPPGGYDVSTFTIGNDTGSSLRVPSGWFTALYADQAFGGTSQGYTSDQSSLGAMNDRASSVWALGAVQIFQHRDFGGASAALFAGNHDVADLGLANDSLSSLRIPAGWRVRLYEHGGFSGASTVFTEGDIAYVGSSWNDRVSSIRVEIPVSVYLHADQKGKYSQFWPGSYVTGNTSFADNAISSVYVPPGFQIVLYDNNNFTGTSWTFNSGSANVGSANDKASSFIVRRL